MQSFVIKPTRITDDRSGEINELLRDIPDGSTVRFEAGEYYIRENLLLRDKKNIVLDGDGAVIVPFYDPEQPHVTGSDVLYVEHCDGAVIRGFSVRSEKPTNMTGKIVNVTEEYIDVKLSPVYPISDKTNFLKVTVCDDEWYPKTIIPINSHSTEKNSVIAGELITTRGEELGAKHEDLGGDVHRIYYNVYEPNVPVGANVILQHTYYGLCAFAFRSSHNVTVENVHIDDYGGFCFAILPRSSNFTFRGVRCESSDKEHRRYSACADAIHTTGLYGSFKIENCFFDGIGDDVLNIHALMLSVKEKTENKLKLVLDKERSKFPKRFIEKGDPLYVFDGENIELKGEMKVLAVEGDDGETVTVDKPEIASEGDYIFNYYYMPDVEIKNTNAVHCRSRFCIQSGRNVEICGNGLNMCLSKAPIYISVAFSFWREAGIIENVSIHDNVISAHVDGTPAIWLRINETEPEKMKYRHGNISIENNEIYGTVDLRAAESLRLIGNRIKTCSDTPVELHDCRNVTAEGNVIVK